MSQKAERARDIASCLMRVLLVTQFYPPLGGGQERHVRDLAHALFDRGHQVEVATIATSGNDKTALDGPIPVHRLRTATQRLPGVHSDSERPHVPVADPRFRTGIEHLLARGSFDVVHAHDWIVNSVIGPAGARSTPVVLTLHDYSHVCTTKRMMQGNHVCSGPAPVKCVECAMGKYGPLIGPGVVLANFLGRRSRRQGVARFVAVSSGVASRSKLLGDSRIEVVPNFVPDELLVGPAEIEEMDPTSGPLLFVGDVTLDKGVGVLFEAYRRMPDPPPLLVVGREQADAPKDRLAEVEMLGPRNPEKVRSLMRSARVVVVPSIVLDACPTVVLEAMAAARPVVASTSGGIVELVEEGVTGLLVPPDDASALGAALSQLLEDPVTSKEMGLKGLEKCRRYTASQVSAELENLYSGLVSAAV